MCTIDYLEEKKCVQFNTYLSKKDSYVCMGGVEGGGGRLGPVS